MVRDNSQSSRVSTGKSESGSMDAWSTTENHPESLLVTSSETQLELVRESIGVMIEQTLVGRLSA